MRKCQTAGLFPARFCVGQLYSTTPCVRHATATKWVAAIPTSAAVNRGPTDVASSRRERVKSSTSALVQAQGPIIGARMLVITPIDLREANAFVAKYHRHHRPVPGAKFCVAVSDHNGVVRGVAIIGRPVERALGNGWTLEANRICTDGAKNACSMLYSAAWKAAKALGYRRLITYTLPNEGGASLRASNWRMIGERGGGSWNCPSRPRIDTAELLAGQKLLWEAV